MLTGTEHFPLSELEANTEWPIPPAYQDNAQATLEALEGVRAVLGVKLRLTSLWRAPASNAALPGSVSTSAHLRADAADFVPVGLSFQEAAARWAAAVDAGTAPELHQFLIEEQGEDGLGAHVHISRGTGQQTIARLANGTYVTLADWLGRAADAVSSTAHRATSAAASSPGVVSALLALAGGALLLRLYMRRPHAA